MTTTRRPAVNRTKRATPAALVAATGTTGYTDNLGAEIRIGDTVRIAYWGGAVRLADTGARALVKGLNRAGNLVLDGAPFGYADLANGRGVRHTMVLVCRRDGAQGYEGNR